jgi:hypothetical protein
MRPAERDSLTEAIKRQVAAVMAREVAASKGFAEDIAFTLTSSIESDPHARRWLMTSALSSAVLKQALIQKLVMELR